MRRSIRVRLAGVVAAALVAGPAAAGATPADPPPSWADRPATESKAFTFVDPSRPTPPNGSFAGSPRRVLRTLVLRPAHADGGGLPLIVFSHGFDSSGPEYAPLLRQWAAAGFVVAAPTFPLSSRGAPGGPTVADYAHQPGDVSFVITRMLRLAGDRRSPLGGMIDPSRIAVAGHSLGAITVLGAAFNSCCRDPRIRAVVSLSGIELGFPNGAYFTGPPIPLLLFHGTADQTVPYASSVQLFRDAAPPKFFVTLIGAPHTAFRQASTASLPAPQWEPVIVRATIDFLDRYLGRDRGAKRLLVHEATVPGVATIQIDVMARHPVH